MKKGNRPEKSIHVVMAVAVVLVLTLLLGVRITAQVDSPPTGTGSSPDRTSPAPPAPPAPEVSPAIPAEPEAPVAPVATPAVPPAPPAPVAPAAGVPAPPAPPVSDLQAPCWGCPGNRTWSVSFRTDLDLLAPLGDGPANAAVWFADFTVKEIGPRYFEWKEATARMVAHGGLENVLPPDDPLLLEAEPWCDQARMWFYPDFFPIEGYATGVPNLLFPLALAKSWVARGNTADDPADALEDYRRAIRLGRLLRQEDAVIINDLVGLACIRYGAEGIFRFAVGRGDTELALVASLVLGEYGPQRLMTSDRVTITDITPFASVSSSGDVVLELPDERLDHILDRAMNDPDRRFRGEATVVLNFVAHLGSPEQRERVLAVLNDLVASPDPLVSQSAVWARDTAPDTQWLEPPPTN